MKFTITILLCFIGLVSFAQKEIDENGRLVGSKPSLSVSSVQDVYLEHDKGTVGNGLKVNYSLPTGVNLGKIVVFDPRRDVEKLTITLSTETGNVSIDPKAVGLTDFALGLYDNTGKFLKSLNVSY